MTIGLTSFEDWWAPFEEPAGSVGDYLATRTPEQVAELRDLCRTRLPDGPFELTVWTWTAVPGFRRAEPDRWRQSPRSARSESKSSRDTSSPQSDSRRASWGRYITWSDSLSPSGQSQSARAGAGCLVDSGQRHRVEVEPAPDVVHGHLGRPPDLLVDHDDHPLPTHRGGPRGQLVGVEAGEGLHRDRHRVGPRRRVARIRAGRGEPHRGAEPLDRVAQQHQDRYVGHQSSRGGRDRSVAQVLRRPLTPAYVVGREQVEVRPRPAAPRRPPCAAGAAPSCRWCRARPPGAG